MNFEHASTDIDAEERPSKEVKGTGSAQTNGAVPPPPPPGAARSDFAASAAMVNDILAAGPSDPAPETDQSRQDPAEEAIIEPEPATGSSAAGPSSADFFSRPKPKQSFWQLSKPKEPSPPEQTKRSFWRLSKPKERSGQGEAETPAKSKRSFWRLSKPKERSRKGKADKPAKSKQSFWRLSKPKERSRRGKAAKPAASTKSKQSFWQMKLTLRRRPRAGAHSEGRRRPLPDP
jgi:hypothetical protein